MLQQVIEVVEPESQLYATLVQRCRDINKYECKIDWIIFDTPGFVVFGPPDLCYLVKQ